MNRINKLVFSLLIASASIAGIIKLQLPYISDSEGAISAEEYQRLEKKESLQVLLLNKLPDFGYNNLTANLVYLNFIQYYGDAEAREVTGYRLSPDYFKTVVAKDPRFVTSYYIMEPATTLFAGEPKISHDLIVEGLKIIQPTQPLAHQLWIYKGILEILFLGDLKEAQKSYQMAAKWAKIENTEESLSVAQVAEGTAKFLATEPDNRKIAGSSWLTIALNARDEATRERALAEIDKLGGKVMVEGNRVFVRYDN
ncbi:MAG: hypothetical protein IGQ45_07565 [Cyanobacterium sp. T60_A2020_053]|nr:hypothetical protein [Cyanobacterium sp. T60_A2020_053]